MIIETPITILKQLVELIDPHVGVTKLIKTGTAQAFYDMAESAATKKAVKKVNDKRREALPEEMRAGFKGMTGEDLVKLLLCLVDLGMSTGMEAAVNIEGLDPEMTNNFFPKVTYDGVDFTGTISGMFMIPPSPLGIIYLLLELLKADALSEQTNTSESGEPSDCA
jgi:hypothetical protein